MTRARSNALVLLSALLAGCATFQISTDYDPAARFTGLRTYDWTTAPQRHANDPLVDTDSLLRQRVMNAVDGALSRRGYRRTSQSPDFVVSFYFTRDRKLGASTATYAPVYGGFFGGPYYGYWGGWYYPGYYGYATYPRSYEESLLVIDLQEPAHHNLLWRAMIRDYVRFRDTPQSRELRVNEAITAALERFPPH